MDDPAAELEEAQNLVNVLLDSRGYDKLTIGSDGMWSRYLPKKFLTLFV